MRTLGVDLASQAANTAAVAIDWPEDARPRVLGLSAEPLTDDVLVALFTSGDYERIALDAPLGWPDAMVEDLSAWRDLRPVDIPTDRRRSGGDVIHRETDREVHRRTGMWPLSPGVNTLGWVTLRAMHLLSRAGAAGARDGVDSVFLETYPKAVASGWFPDLASEAKRDPAARDRVLRTLEDELGMDFGGEREAIVSQGDRNHSFDALLCALAARAAALGTTGRPRPEQIPLARREGWIHLPDCPLDALRVGV